MSAPESFTELVRARLVNPRRNITRALELLSGIPYAQTGDGIQRLMDAEADLRYLAEFVDSAAKREVHTCSCGHTHYVHGDDA